MVDGHARVALAISAGERVPVVFVDLSEQEERVRQFKEKYLGELPGQTQSNLQILSGLQAQLQAEQDNLSRARQQNTYLATLLSQYRTIQRSTKSGGGAPGGLPA